MGGFFGSIKCFLAPAANGKGLSCQGRGLGKELEELFILINFSSAFSPFHVVVIRNPQMLWGLGDIWNKIILV